MKTHGLCTFGTTALIRAPEALGTVESTAEGLVLSSFSALSCSVTLPALKVIPFLVLTGFSKGNGWNNTCPRDVKLPNTGTDDILLWDFEWI